MRTLFIAAASALFFAALVTELYMRLWPGQYFALLVLTFVMLLASGLLNLRLAARTAPAAQSTSGNQRQSSRPSPRKLRDTESQPRSPGRRNTRTPDTPAPAEEQRNDAASSGPRESGTVKWFNRTKGFGFVIRESGEEIFVHQRSIRLTGEGDNRRRPALRDGQGVTFVVAEREKGLQAEDVVPVE